MKLQFSVGQNIFVERRVGRMRVKATSRILGARDPNYLVIEMPQIESKTVFLGPSEDCIVRFLDGGRMIGFWVHTTRVVLDPFPFAVVRYSDEYEEVTVRHHDRLDCNIAATLALYEPAPARNPAQNGVIPKKGEMAGETNAKKSSQGASPAAAPPSALRATIINLGLGGFQAVVPIYDAEDPRGAASLVALEIPWDQHTLYVWNSLEASCTAGTRGKADFAVPPPVDVRYAEVRCEIRWATRRKENLFLGFCLLDPPEELSRSIDAIVRHQLKYFVSPVKPV